jgi:hypothetical protein
MTGPRPVVVPLSWPDRFLARYSEGVRSTLRTEMTITLTLKPETERFLREQAASRGQDVAEYLQGLIETALKGANGSAPGGPHAGMSFDAILAPVRKEVETSGLTDEELDELFRDTIEEVRREKDTKRSEP